jgi:hypothetical protein
MSAGLGERRKRTMHLKNSHHVTEFTVEAAKERKDHLPIADGVTELGEGGGHGLERAAEVGDGHGVLTEVAELRLQEESPRLLLPEKFVLEVAPRLAGVALADHEGLL